MYRAKTIALLAAITLQSFQPVPSRADITIEPVLGCAGEVVVDVAAGTSRWSPAPREVHVFTDVYDNLGSPPLFGIASTVLTTIWGDSLEISQTGVVEEIAFTIFNANSSGGFITEPQVAFNFYAAATMQHLMGLHFFPTFQGGLPPGYYAIVRLTNLSVLPFAIGTTHLVVRQTIEAGWGLATQLGVISFSPPTIGASPPSLYNSSGASGPGWYRYAQGPADLGCQIRFEVTSPAQATSWGRLKRIYR